MKKWENTKGKEAGNFNLPVSGVVDFEEEAGCFVCFAVFFGCWGACLSARKVEPSVYKTELS